MKFPIAAIMFLVASFIFFILYVVMTFLLSTVYGVLSPLGSSFSVADNASYMSDISTVQFAFGFICVLFLIVGIILIFVLESWSDEPEYYYRQ
jgi:hypothetical protein